MLVTLPLNTTVAGLAILRIFSRHPNDFEAGIETLALGIAALILAKGVRADIRSGKILKGIPPEVCDPG